MSYKAEGLNHLNTSAYTANLNNLFSELGFQKKQLLKDCIVFLTPCNKL